MTQPQAIALEQDIAKARRVLGRRNLVFVGLMGAGKSAIGRLVAQMLEIPFVDSDHEIERVSRMTIPELFEAYGEPEFRALEARVIKRLLKTGPRVLSTGGGAFMNDTTRTMVLADGLSVWKQTLRAARLTKGAVSPCRASQMSTDTPFSAPWRA